jgi:hypothetical protein
LKIPLTPKARASRLNSNPIQSANLFLALKRFVYETLFGMAYSIPEGEGTTKKSLPRFSRKMSQSRYYEKNYKPMFGRFETFETPPMGQGLAFADVAEEQDRGKEHMHSTVFTNMRPEAVQIVSGLRFLEEIVVVIMDSLSGHELPAIVHLRHILLQECLRFPPERYARETFEVTSIEDVTKCAHKVAASVNIHSHSRTCKKGDGDKCRLGYRRPMSEKSSVVQLSRNAEGKIDIHEPEPRVIVRKEGLIPRDPRCVLAVPACREITIDGVSNDDFTHVDLRLGKSNESGEDTALSEWKTKVIKKLNNAVPSHFDKQLTDEEVKGILSLSRKSVELLISLMPSQNKFVAPFNQTAMGTLRCNEAAMLLNSEASCDGVSGYVIKYMTKGDYPLNRSIDTIAAAHQNLQDYKTAPLNNETQMIRDAKKFYTRMLNNTDGDMKEFFMTTIAYANQGGLPFNCSDEFVYLFIYDAVRRLISFYDETQEIDNRVEVNFGGATLYKNEKGETIPLSQFELYLHRIHPSYRKRALDAQTEAQNQISQYISNNEVINSSHLNKLEKRFYKAKREVSNNVENLNLREFVSNTKLVPFGGNFDFDTFCRNELSSDNFGVEDKQVSVGRKVYVFLYNQVI